MEWNIEMIESIAEKSASEIAEEHTTVKGHDIYFVDFEGYFGYSMLVYLNGGYIHYANDYELHHGSHKGDKQYLRNYYIEQAKRKLFTEAEFAEPIKTYDEYNAKRYYIYNYYPMQKERESIFAINPTDEKKRAFKERTKDWTYNPIGFCYMPDKDFVKRNIELANQLEKAKEDTLNNFDYWKSAFLYEMWNHEYAINWEADYSTLSAFGNIGWHEDDIATYFKELGFNETQKAAYRAARAQYWDEQKEAM